MVGQALISLMVIKTADGKQNFLTCLHLLNFKLGSPSRLLPTLSALHAIRRYHMQFAPKDIWLPFAIALKAISDPLKSCRKAFDYRMQHGTLLFCRIFWILNLWSFFASCNKNLIPFIAVKTARRTKLICTGKLKSGLNKGLFTQL